MRALPLGLLLTVCALSAADTEIKEFKKTIPLKPDALLALQSEDGGVEVSGWDQPTVEIYARISMETGNFKSKYAVQDTEIKVEGSEAGWQIRADFSKVQQSSWSMLTGGPARPSVHFKIRVPRAARVKVRTENGESRITDLRGELDFEGMRGDVHLSGIEGVVRLQTMSGDIEARFLKPAGPSSVETMRGDVSLYFPAKAKFDIEPKIGQRGTVTSDFGQTLGAPVKEPTKVNGGGPRYRVSTMRGSVSFKKL
ncbi:MAG: DUF4097 family beta strand repeat-containing protein [Bryobacteraceae bacterium]